MITAGRSCGCTYTPKCSSVSTPCTPLSKTSAPFSTSRIINTASNCSSKTTSRPNTRSRQPFENPARLKSTRFSEEARCPCPRPDNENYKSMNGKCSSCCPDVLLPESKIVSKIVEGGKPYKEIEAIINNNQMVIRIQKESLESEWDPPCDCVDGNLGADEKIGRLGGGGGGCCGSNVVFQKSDNSKVENCYRTVTIFPESEIITNENRRGDDDKMNNNLNEKKEKKENTKGLIDLEDNPNIFVLRIRKKSENSDGKNNIDLEFRTPRPWINMPKPKPVITPPKPQSPPDKKAIEKPAKGKKKK